MATSDRRPFFSVLITAYNRADQIERCVLSRTRQTFGDLEVVVVDDASTDATPTVLAAIEDPRLRVVTHPGNRGIAPARATAVQQAKGQWLVMLDSDWELLPHSLDRLRTLIAELPPGVRMIRSRLQWDDGTVSPTVMPLEPITDFHGRLRWLEAVSVAGGSSDAGHCIHRAVFDAWNYPSDRRGALETLWETDLAEREPSLWSSEVLGLEHVDAANSVTRGASLDRLLAEAPDQLWVAEEMWRRHGPELSRLAPHYSGWVLEGAAREALLAGDRRKGLRYTFAAARAGASAPKLAATLGLGLVGRRALAAVKVAGRRRRGGRVARRRVTPAATEHGGAR